MNKTIHKSRLVIPALRLNGHYMYIWQVQGNMPELCMQLSSRMLYNTIGKSRRLVISPRNCISILHSKHSLVHLSNPARIFWGNFRYHVRNYIICMHIQVAKFVYWSTEQSHAGWKVKLFKKGLLLIIIKIFVANLSFKSSVVIFCIL